MRPQPGVRTHARRAVSALVTAVATSAAAQPVAEVPCDGTAIAVLVTGATSQDRETACRGATDALAFFAAYGLAAPDRVRIRVTTTMPPGTSDSAAGCYDETTGTVHRVPYDRFRRFRTWFGVPIDRAMHRSLATHEVAHAMTGCNFAPPRPTIRAKEYVAYVAMFAAMDPPVRGRILARHPDRGFASADRLTPVLSMFDPMTFGVASWRHRRSDGGGPAFLRQVLAGQAMTD